MDFERAVADLSDCYEAAFSKTFEQFKIPFDKSKLDEYINTPTDVLFDRYYKGCTCKYRDFVIMFMGAFDAAFSTKARLLPGIGEKIKEQHDNGSKIGILSNISEMYVDMLLSVNNIRSCIDSVIGVEKSIIPRPETYSLNQCIKEMGISAEECVFVGESEINRTMCQKAGMELLDSI